jgi:hypothetical protein
MKKVEFSTRETVRVLSESNDPAELYWAVFRLLAWAFLDQKTGKQQRGARNARHVSHILLSKRLHENWIEIEKGSINDALQQLLITYRTFGGIKRGIVTPTPRTLMQRFKKIEVETRIVFQIVSYLCRVKADESLDAKKFTINYAKEFVKKVQKPRSDKKPYGDSKISKIWEKYAPSAPVVYAAYRIMPTLGNAESPEQISLWLREMSVEHNRLRRLIGYAASAADVLAETTARKVFTKSFADAPREKFSLESFSEQEWEVISAIDLNAPIL